MDEEFNLPKKSLDYLERCTHAPLEPPPTPDEIRRQLGWHLIPALRQPDRETCDR